MLDGKYEDILLGIKKALEYMNKNVSYRDGSLIWTSVDGYHIGKLGGIKPDDTWFPKIDWLLANGYIVQGKPQWCDITQSYVETYGLTIKGNKYIERNVWKEIR